MIMDKQQELFQRLMPDTARIFQELMTSTFKDGVLSFRTKELIAIGIAVSMGCDDCINHHVGLALEDGTAKEEIAEAMAVGFEMGAGQLYSPILRALSSHFGDQA